MDRRQRAGDIRVKDRSIPQLRVVHLTLSPPLNGGIFWGVGTVYGRTLTYSLGFNTWGTREIYVCLRDRTRKRFYWYERNLRSKIRTRVLNDVKCEGIPY